MTKRETVNLLTAFIRSNPDIDQKTLEAVTSAIDIINDSIYYRWHDIVRNGHDLPEEGSEIVYIFSYPGKCKNRKRSSNTGKYKDPSFFDEWHDMKVIAWKYLEKFQSK